jgi:hypothetical protein
VGNQNAKKKTNKNNQQQNTDNNHSDYARVHRNPFPIHRDHFQRITQKPSSRESTALIEARE